MPDGDSLNWKVRGRRSRVVVGLVRSGADPRLVGQESARMLIFQANENNWKPLIREVGMLLSDGRIALRNPEGFSARSARTEEICDGIQGVIDDHGDGSARWMFAPARRALLSSDASGHSQVRSELMASLNEALLDHRVLQPVRPDLTREKGWSRREQFAFEQELKAAARSEGAKLVRTFFDGPPDTAVRMPARAVPLRTTDLDRLNESLTVLGGL